MIVCVDSNCCYISVIVIVICHYWLLARVEIEDRAMEDWRERQEDRSEEWRRAGLLSFAIFCGLYL